MTDCEINSVPFKRIRCKQPNRLLSDIAVEQSDISLLILAIRDYSHIRFLSNLKLNLPVFARCNH